MYSASLRIKADDSRIFEALDLPSYKRSRVVMKRSKQGVSFEIKSDDVVALVATLSSITKQLMVISSVRSLVGKEARAKGNRRA